MIPPAVGYMQTDLRSGIDNRTYTGWIANHARTIADTDANTYELPPSFFLLYPPRLNSVLALYVDSVYLFVSTAAPHGSMRFVPSVASFLKLLAVLPAHPEWTMVEEESKFLFCID